MFKKRGVNINKTVQSSKQGGTDGKAMNKKDNLGGINLMRDIQEIQTNINQSKSYLPNRINDKSNQKEQFGNDRQNGNNSNRDDSDDQRGGNNNINISRSDNISNQMSKTKRINKFTTHIMNRLPVVRNNHDSRNDSHLPHLGKQSSVSGGNPVQKSGQVSHFVKTEGKIIEQGTDQIKNNDLNIHRKTQPELVKPILSNYGLLDESHFGTNPILKVGGKSQPLQQSKTHQQTLMDYYIKKKMQQLTKNTSISNSKTNPTNPGQPATTSTKTYTLKQRPTQAWQQVLQLQNQYLTQQEKVKDYSIQEIQKKLQKQATLIIKSEIQKRHSYLKDLLENQYEKMEYASKKQLKIMKQDKQRIERQLESKYKQSGRRHYIDTIKNSVL